MHGVRYWLPVLMVVACEKSGPVSSQSSSGSDAVVGPQQLDRMHGIRPTTVPPTESSLVVEIAADNGILVGGKPLTRDQLEPVFRAASARDHDTQVIVKAQPGVPHGTVVQILETAKLAGLRRLAFGTTSLALPSAASSTDASLTAVLMVSITADGKLFLGSTASTLDEVDKAFRKAAARDPATKVVIQADKSAAYKTVVEIMEHAKTDGLSSVALTTAP